MKISMDSLAGKVDKMPESNVQNQYSDICAKKDVDLLKSLKVDKINMGTFKEKLKLTSSYRKKMLSDLSIDLLECFPYFFTCPKLVSWVCPFSYFYNYIYFKMF